jgi:hypothetical protein
LFTHWHAPVFIELATGAPRATWAEPEQRARGRGRTTEDAGWQVFGTAAEQAKNVAQDAKVQARDLVGEARSQVAQQARTGKHKVADPRPRRGAAGHDAGRCAVRPRLRSGAAARRSGGTGDSHWPPVTGPSAGADHTISSLSPIFVPECCSSASTSCSSTTRRCLRMPLWPDSIRSWDSGERRRIRGGAYLSTRGEPPTCAHP